jgi:hypothetical protein
MMLNLDKEALLEKWKDISNLAHKTFSEKISLAELEKVKGNINLMITLVEEKLGVSRDDAQKKVEELLGKINQNDLRVKAEETASKVLETANVLLDVVKEKIKKK